ncbi:MAG: DUF1573 domain-containing protein [Pirellulales bacterium]|nr:DUF1573 domain-containing protein [Pirellulales bacterium]
MLRKVSLFCVLALLIGSPGWGQEWARKMFETTSHDFGSIARNAKAEYEFVLSNIYLEDVHVASVRSSCGCTSPRIKNPLLKTYEKGAIVASINSGSFLGQKGATLTVTIDKPLYAEVQLHVRAYIRNDVVFSPSSVQLGEVDQGVPADTKVEVSYSGRSDWRIVGVKSANPHVTAKAIQKRKDFGRVAYDLLVHLDENAPAGFVRDHVMLVTNDRQSQIPVLVEGQVLSGITVSPSSLFMGVVEPGKKITKPLVVRGKKPFRVLSITCDDDSFEFGTTDEQAAKTVHVIPVTFVAGAEAGRVAKTIRIQTDLGQMTPELAAYAVISTR